MKKILVLASCIALSLTVNAQFTTGKLQNPNGSTTSDTVAASFTMAINTLTYNNTSKSRLPGTAYLAVQLNVRRADSVKTAYVKFEASNDGIVWHQPNPLDSVVLTPVTTGTDTIAYPIKYGPVLWKYNRIKGFVSGTQKFRIWGNYNNL